MPHTQLHAALRVRHHRRALGFGARARSGGNADQLWENVIGGQFWHVAIKIKLPDVAFVMSGERCGLAGVHSAPAANGDHAVVASLPVGCSRQHNVRISRVRRNLCEDFTGDTGAEQGLLQRVDERQACRPLIGNDQGLCQPQVRCVLPHFPEATGTVGNRHGKRPIMIGE